jgi:hypothetical protein
MRGTRAARSESRTSDFRVLPARCIRDDARGNQVGPALCIGDNAQCIQVGPARFLRWAFGNRRMDLGTVGEEHHVLTTYKRES